MTKKQPTKTKEKEESTALVASTLSSSALSAYADYDLSQFSGVKLDTAENKELFKNDIIVPKVQLVQAMSEFRKEKKADEGQYVNSQTAELLADLDQTLKFVVLKTFKRWQTFKVVEEKGKTKREFVSSEIMVLGKNENLPYEEIAEGDKLVRRQVISAYVLLESEAMKAVNKPYIIDFAASSKFGGRKMVSDISTLNNNNLPSFVAYFTLSSKIQKFEDGDAFVKDVNFGGYLPKTMMPFLIDCYKSLESIEDQIVIDDADIIDEAKTSKNGEEVETNVAGKAKAMAKDAGI